jgi:hypothetical protein
MNKQYAFFQRSVGSLRGPLAIAPMLVLGQASAQLNVAAVNTAYTINFDGTVSGVESGAWAGGGFQAVPISGRLDSDAWSIIGFSDGNLAYGGSQIAVGTDYRRGTTAPGNAAVSVGGLYSFGGAGITGRALGVQPNATDFTPGTITLRVQNNTGSTITAFDVAYDVYYRNDQANSDNFNLYYSDNNVTYTQVPSQDVVSPAAAAGAAWVANARSTTITGVNVPNGQYVYVRWRGDEVVGGGSDDEFALDNISVTGRAYTLVRCTAATSTALENVGTTNITFSITNPHPTNATTVDLALTSGPAARINSYTTQTITFPGGSVANQNVIITVTDNGACDGDATEVFALQNIAGGLGTPSIGTPAGHTLTIDDDESGAAPTIAQFFDGVVGDNWSITAGAGNQSSTVGGGDTPANQRVLSSTQSWQRINGTSTLDLGTTSIVDWSGITLSARVSSPSLSTINGNDGADSIAFYVSLNGGAFPLDPDVRIAGNSNARWGYTSGTGVVSTTAGTPVNVGPAAGGNRTTDGYSTVNITIPNGTSTIALRVIAKNNDPTEIWCLDNVQINGTLCSPIYYSRANGSETTGTWSTSRTGVPAPGVVTFNKNASMVVQNTHVVTTNSNANIAVRDLNVETGGSLSLAGVSTVGINGTTLDIDGPLSAADDNIDLLGTSLMTLSGSAGTIDVNNLTLNGFGAIVTVNTLKIRGTLQLDKGNFNANNKEVQLISTSTGTARLGPVSATASYTSKMRLERFIPAGVTDWRLLCSPLTANTVADWTDDFYTAGFPGSYYPNFYVNMVLWPSVRKYNEPVTGGLLTDGLVGVSSVSEALTPGRGFAAWSGTTLNTTTAFTIDVVGAPTVASTPFSIPLTYTNNGFPAVDGLNLVGNPLPSPIDFTDITLTNVANNYYIYDPGASANVGWDETLSIGTGGCNGNIQSSQGFWLTATAASPSATLNESAKVLEPINGGIFSDENDRRPMVRLYLSDQAETFTDEALVHFIAGEGAYGQSDMLKLEFGNDSASFISTKATTGEDLMINAYGELTGPMEIPVKVVVSVSGEYTIGFGSAGSLGGRACLTLEDLLTGNTVAVTDDASMTFTIDASAPVEPARFVLHIGEPVTTASGNATCAGLDNGTITVTGPGSGSWTYSLVDEDENVTVQGPLEGAAEFNGLAAGSYRLSVEGNTGCGALVQDVVIDAPGPLDGSATTEASACLDAADGTADLMVMGGTGPYTFAWSDGSTEEDLSGAPAGVYSVSITDANGCTAEVADIQVTSEAGPVASFEVSTTDVLPMSDVFFFNTGTYGLDYEWNFGDGATSTENEPVHQYAESGTYTVTLTALAGECSDVFSQDLLVGSTGIAAPVSNGVSAWTEGSQFIVLWQVDGSKGITAEVIDATGRSVAQRTALGAMGRISMSAQDLPSGVYFVRVRTAGAERTFKLPLAR